MRTKAELAAKKAAERRADPHYKARRRAWLNANKERLAAQAKAYRATRPPEEIRAVVRAYREKNHARIRERERKYRADNRLRYAILHVSKKYNVSRDEAARWLAIETCESCGEAPATDIDHVHLPNGETGAIVGRLCHACNVAEGHLQSSVSRTLKLAEYIRRTRSQSNPPEPTNEPEGDEEP